MLKKGLKWIGLILAGLVGLVVLAVITVFIIGGSKLGQVYNVPQETLIIPADADAIARGEVLANVSGCTGCHTANLGGETFMEETSLATISASNLTSGWGGCW